MPKLMQQYRNNGFARDEFEKDREGFHYLNLMNIKLDWIRCVEKCIPSPLKLH